MNTDAQTGPAADDEFVERLAGHLDRYASGDHSSAGAADPFGGQGATDAAVLAEELRSAHTWAAPPPGLRDSILARVRAQAPATEPVTARGPATEPSGASSTRDAHGHGNDGPQRRPARWRARWGRLAWAVPAAALAAVLFTVGVLAVDRALQPHGQVYVVTGTQLDPAATAEVEVRETGSGLSIVVNVDKLPSAAPGSYYAAWLQGPRGVVPIGSFHEHRAGTPIKLWSGVDLSGYPTFLVTLQAEGDPPCPSTLVVMTATLA